MRWRSPFDPEPEAYWEAIEAGECICGPRCFDPELGPFHNDNPACPVHGDKDDE